ncbi:MATE family efflux transporter [Nocardioides sp. TRM66260-LWL]|uniref:MATE family efflux transporter n=1 Tax=Nocardioides sp. TRM66260-LWL TaxID=2874478 RepID=UPI001CC58825|nr:MATE family efflux transporter [Nocardioides sp. TRM66260-LWL]MBZ5735590.1 MATE family efflux transporter [Nocardioides sp. TRM66260-LWL]
MPGPDDVAEPAASEQARQSGTPPQHPQPAGRDLDRAIARLALPALATLVAEPLLLLGDSVIVGHLGTRELAALGLAGAVVQTIVGLCVFLAYGTTAQVARLLGAGRGRDALAQGVDGLWLAVAIGVLVTPATALLAEPLVRALGAGDALAAPAAQYLRIAALGVTPLLVLLAASGVLRGRQDTRTPLLVTTAMALANLGLNAVLVLPLGLGLAGSAIGTVIAQTAGALALAAAVLRQARSSGSRLRPDAAGVLAAARAGVPLVVRTLTLRAALLATTAAVAAGATGATGATDARAVDLAAHQLALTLWTFTAFVLDALAIAAQALVGQALGAGDPDRVRRTVRRLVGWSLAVGVGTGLLLLATPLAGGVLTPDAAVRARLGDVLLVAALAQPLAAYVFLLDGVLIGAGDGRYLARAGLVVLAVYLPAVAAATSGGLVAVWIAFAAVLMGARAVVLGLRTRSGRWMVLGADGTSART